jgi:glycosyltransferase involved in cell wall biosynthesis
MTSPEIDTAERLRRFGDAITYLRKPNGGQASAFNFGLEKARGEFVAFLDADDYWLPGKLQRIVEAFEEHRDAGIVYHARSDNSIRVQVRFKTEGCRCSRDFFRRTPRSC